jgi:hypothetical protein
MVKGLFRSNDACIDHVCDLCVLMVTCLKPTTASPTPEAAFRGLPLTPPERLRLSSVWPFLMQHAGSASSFLTHQPISSMILASSRENRLPNERADFVAPVHAAALDGCDIPAARGV